MGASRFSALPAAGAVLGIDVGFSAIRRSTCLCRLAWDARSAKLDFIAVGSGTVARRRAVVELGVRELAAVALDGPLAPGLRLLRRYRAAEAILSRGAFQKRGKPGATNTPTGLKLHFHATRLARLVLAAAPGAVAPATHWQPIHARRIVEAFPNLFLAALVDEADLPPLARDATDKYWTRLIERSDRLERLLRLMLEGRALDGDLARIVDHDERAAVACALTALCVARGEHVAVGDAAGGDIMLPPPAAWGASRDGTGSWFEEALRANVRAVRLSFRLARIATATGVWL